ncbi:hypothetical protein H5410_047710 [Solanum commersonii]|uniref:Uncharacterized protein n=1 Tax=Solanum commersonii TaxID=4109 RepID=A0A9J5XJ21_SOLCO|nr:hypothetical protein H5410_047710 [Solanum commersonii]
MEAEGFAINYDSMMQLQNEIQAVAVGAAIGQACLLLAAGTKGKIRHDFWINAGHASDVYIRAKEC